MDYRGFISTVQDRAHISGEEAERTACATLQTLADRLTAGEAQDIAERLPGELRTCIPAGGGPEPFHVDEFLRRIEERGQVDRSSAERDARAVFTALWHAVGPEEFGDMRSELPKDFDPLLDEAVIGEVRPVEAGAPPAGALTADQFVERVATRARLHRARAQRATEAVLEVLATRIAGGQVAHMETQLPPELRAPLERGRAETGGAARPLSLVAFLRDIAEREGVSRGEATEHARAVLATLREAVGEKEFTDATKQFPGEYQPLLKQG